MHAKSVRSLRADARLLLTGAPLQNRLRELWVVMSSASPEIFGSAEDFDQWFQLEDAANVEKLQSLLRYVHACAVPAYRPPLVLWRYVLRISFVRSFPVTRTGALRANFRYQQVQQVQFFDSVCCGVHLTLAHSLVRLFWAYQRTNPTKPPTGLSCFAAFGRTYRLGRRPPTYIVMVSTRACSRQIHGPRNV